MLPNPRLTVSISRLFLGMNFPFPRPISDETWLNFPCQNLAKVPQIRRLRRNCLRPPRDSRWPATSPQARAQNFDQGNFLWFFRFRGYFSIFLKPTVGVKRGTVLKITALPVGLSDEMPEMTLEDLDSLASAALRRRTNMTWETFNRFKDDTRAICFLEHYERDDGEYI